MKPSEGGARRNRECCREGSGRVFCLVRTLRCPAHEACEPGMGSHCNSGGWRPCSYVEKGEPGRETGCGRGAGERDCEKSFLSLWMGGIQSRGTELSAFLKTRRIGKTGLWGLSLGRWFLPSLVRCSQ